MLVSAAMGRTGPLNRMRYGRVGGRDETRLFPEATHSIHVFRVKLGGLRTLKIMALVCNSSCGHGKIDIDTRTPMKQFRTGQPALDDLKFRFLNWEYG